MAGGRGQKAEGRRQKAEGGRRNPGVSQLRTPGLHKRGGARWLAAVSGKISLIGAIALTATAAIGQTRIYTPLPIAPGRSLTDRLTKNDIPTGQGGFARDYVVQLQAGSQVTVDVSSESFDAIIYLIGADGATIAENDDGPDGSTNALLFTRIAKTGTYTIRVRSFGDAAGGNFTLKVTLLQPQ